MSDDRLLSLSDRWFRVLLRFYPPDFRDEMGEAIVETYRDQTRDALVRGRLALARIWLRALGDAFRNGLGERYRPAVRWRRGGDWGRDIELVRRRLLRAPVFLLTTVGTLTIGLGMFAVVYTAVEKILIAPMPYRHPDDLYVVWRDYGPILDLKRGGLSGIDIPALQAQRDVIEDVASLQRCFCGIFSTGRDESPIEITVTRSSPNLFTLLGVTPAIGRGFAPNEVGPGAPRVIVLTHGLWTRLGADSSMVGSEIHLNGQLYTVIGVLPASFAFVRHEALGPPQPADAYATFDLPTEMNPRDGSYGVLVRARHGTSPPALAAAVAAAGRTIDEQAFNNRGLKLYPVGLKDDLVARVQPALFVLAAAGVVLALMLMVNLASVLFARVAQREREFAVSRALGANDAAIMRATFLEGGTLGLLGGALGALVATWGTRALVALAPLDLPRRNEIAMDWPIAGLVLLLGLALGLIAAAIPAVWAARASLSSLLANSAVRGGGAQGWLRRGLVVIQVALSLILLSSGGLAMRSFERLLHADPGFQPSGVLTVLVRTPPEFFPQIADVNGFQDRVQAALAAIPGVTRASAASALPLSATTQRMTIRFPGAPGNSGVADRDEVLVDVIGARAGYVETIGMRVIVGHSFVSAPRPGVSEAMIDRSLAERFFGGSNALGATIPFGNRKVTIVGIVDQARLYDLHQDGRGQLYLRAEDWGYRPLFYVIKTEREASSLLPDVRAAVRHVDGRVAVGNARTMEQIVADVLRQQRTSATLITAFAVGALLLATMGLAGVVAGAVIRRRHELAVRMALGADHRRALRLVLRDGALLVGAGLLIAVPGVYVAGRLVRGLLVGVTPWDPLTLLVVAFGLALVAMITCYLPARRVLAIDPARLLREE